MKTKKILIDVTNDFLSKSTPGCGHILFEKGFNFKRNKEEISTALWLFKTFGGEILVLKEKTTYKMINPDFEWNTKFWELKNVSSISSIDNCVRKAIKQIYFNPGGIIIDVYKSNIKLQSLINAIEDRLDEIRPSNLYVIVKSKNNLIMILKKK